MKSFVLFFILLFCAATIGAQNSASKQLYSLFDSEWEWTLQNNPQFATFLGDKRFNSKWDDVSLPAFEKRHAHNIQTLKNLAKINRADLLPKDQLNYDLFQKQIETSVAEFQYHFFLLPVNNLGGITKHGPNYGTDKFRQG